MDINVTPALTYLAHRQAKSEYLLSRCLIDFARAHFRVACQFSASSSCEVTSWLS